MLDHSVAQWGTNHTPTMPLPCIAHVPRANVSQALAAGPPRYSGAVGARARSTLGESHGKRVRCDSFGALLVSLSSRFSIALVVARALPQHDCIVPFMTTPSSQGNGKAKPGVAGIGGKLATPGRPCGDPIRILTRSTDTRGAFAVCSTKSWPSRRATRVKYCRSIILPCIPRANVWYTCKSREFAGPAVSRMFDQGQKSGHVVQLLGSCWAARDGKLLASQSITRTRRN